MYEVINISPEFLDAIGVATKIETDRGKTWIKLRVLNFGIFMSLDHDRETVFQVEDVDEFLMKEKEEKVVDISIVGNFVVRDLFPKIKLYQRNDLDEAALDVSLWINAIIPYGTPLDKTKIRYECYTDQQQAMTDADTELESGNDVKRVLTTKVPLRLKAKDLNA